MNFQTVVLQTYRVELREMERTARARGNGFYCIDGLDETLETLIRTDDWSVAGSIGDYEADLLTVAHRRLERREGLTEQLRAGLTVTVHRLLRTRWPRDPAASHGPVQFTPGLPDVITAVRTTLQRLRQRFDAMGHCTASLGNADDKITASFTDHTLRPLLLTDAEVNAVLYAVAQLKLGPSPDVALFTEIAVGFPGEPPPYADEFGRDVPRPRPSPPADDDRMDLRWRETVAAFIHRLREVRTHHVGTPDTRDLEARLGAMFVRETLGTIECVPEAETEAMTEARGTLRRRYPGLYVDAFVDRYVRFVDAGPRPSRPPLRIAAAGDQQRAAAAAALQDRIAALDALRPSGAAARRGLRERMKQWAAADADDHHRMTQLIRDGHLEYWYPHLNFDAFLHGR